MARGHVWKFILVPFAYGIAGPAGILIGTNIGAGQGGRALRTAWITLPLPALAAEAIGLAAATWPAAWIGSFSGDPAVLAIGTITMRRWDSTRCVRGEAAGGPGLHVDDVDAAAVGGDGVGPAGQVGVGSAAAARRGSGGTTSKSCYVVKANGPLRCLCEGYCPVFVDA